MGYCASCRNQLQDEWKFCPACGRPGDGAPVATAPRTNVAVIVAIVVAGGVGLVAVIGIIAAIAIPNLLNAIDRGKQKRTMADLRSVGTAVESHDARAGEIPVAASIEELATALEPDYIKTCPRQDGWGHTIQYEITDDGLYHLWSPGKDGVPESELAGGPTTDFDCDIVFSDGAFVQWPQGLQH